MGNVHSPPFPEDSGAIPTQNESTELHLSPTALCQFTPAKNLAFGDFPPYIFCSLSLNLARARFLGMRSSFP